MPRGEIFWTDWKKKLRYCSNALKAAQIRKTFMQMQEKILLRQRELGISAGWLRRSCRPTQRMNIKRKAKERIKRERLVGVRIDDVLPVIALCGCQ